MINKTSYLISARNIRVIILALAFIPFQTLTSQTDMKNPTGEVEIILLMGVPQGEFRENITGNGWGINFTYKKSITKYSNIGGNLGFLLYGKNEREIPYSYYSDLITLEEETSSDILMTDLFLELHPPTKVWVPYLKGIVGLNMLSTSTSIRDEDYYGDDEDNEIASSTNLFDWAFSYGYGAGIRWMTSIPSDNEETVIGLFFDVQHRYGGEAEYLDADKEGSIVISDPDDGPVTTTLNPDFSRTDLILYNLGISFNF